MKDPELILEADINLVEQVLINLLVNAMEAVKDVEQPRIILSASVTNNRRPVIRVADNGTGMSAGVNGQDLHSLFQYQENGSGIGLSLCKQIMMLHKGTIQVQSAPGEGTAFNLQF